MNHGKKKRSEFEWEKEIRKDEARINAYMKELRNFIDLPSEEEMIMKKMQKQPELIPQNAEWENSRFADMLEDIDDDVFFNDDWQKKDGADSYILLEKIAYQWCVIQAAEIKGELIAEGMKIICLFGKIMARTADILDIEIDEMPELKIALAKRVISDINSLIGILKDTAEKNTRLVRVVISHIEHLQGIREKLIDITEKVREKIKGEDKNGQR
ncbi:MAG: hypothetical protein A2020_11055 [Lentisphaerae bacterium GWF2_45_14]|nr:MAG: hypothetical protein A2020_11055 [Lentisphaerae bacterium GWF2_45_14]